MIDKDEVAATRSQYRAIALDWEAARDDPAEANRHFKVHHAFYKTIRDSPAGQAAISGLLNDPITAVRLLAATHSLLWDPQRAETALEEIEREDNLYSVDAKWTLRSYRSGKLNLDW